VAEALNEYLERIRALFPDLELGSISLNTDGLANDVVLVNEALVFRFAKGDYGRKALADELRVMAIARPCLSLPIPEPFFVSEDMIAYPFLPGAALRRELIYALSPTKQQILADQLAEFLFALHGIRAAELSSTLAPVTPQRWLELRNRIREKVYPLLLPHQRTWAEQLFGFIDDPDNFAYQPGLIHGDLAPYHLLVDENSARLSGVLDFGTAGLGDPASDFGCLAQNYGERFIDRLKYKYPLLETYLPRMRFYAQAIELEWALLGLESGQDLWFTAHLGGARDLAG
jgi:aminoglycoside 2''-phosphotransferase